MDLKDLLTYELGPPPWSLVSSNGSLATTNKSIFSKELENGVECSQSFGISAGNLFFCSSYRFGKCNLSVPTPLRNS